MPESPSRYELKLGHGGDRLLWSRGRGLAEMLASFGITVVRESIPTILNGPEDLTEPIG